jgi:hypothetical protein
MDTVRVSLRLHLKYIQKRSRRLYGIRLKDIAELTPRYGRLSSSSHLDFCKKLNVDLIDHQEPAAVIVVGIGHLYRTLIPSVYGLEDVETVLDE